MKRPWELWDNQGVAEEIDKTWISNDFELAHRINLARLVGEYYLPGDKVLEVGCGSGLVYEPLIPEVMPNSAYTGFDISRKMLGIAQNRFPEGRFEYDDVYNLSYTDKSYDVVLCFEVLIHLADIEKPIQEMLRVTKRTLIITTWVGLEDETTQESILDSEFLHRVYDPRKLLLQIQKLAGKRQHQAYIRVLSDHIWAYVVEFDATDKTWDNQILPFPGYSFSYTNYIDEKWVSREKQYLTELEQAHGDLEQVQQSLEREKTTKTKLKQDLEQTRADLEQVQQSLEREKTTKTKLKQDLEQTRADLEQVQQSLEREKTTKTKLKQDLEQTRAYLEQSRMRLNLEHQAALQLVDQLELFRNRKILRMFQLFERFNSRNSISPVFQQLKDDEFEFSKI